MLPELRKLVVAFVASGPGDPEAFATIHKQLLVAVQQAVAIFEDAVAAIDGEAAALAVPDRDDRLIELALQHLDEHPD